MNSERALSRRLFFSLSNVVAAVVVGVGVFVGLPARYAPVDVVAALAIALLVGSAAGLGAGLSWGARLARAAAWVLLAIGVVFISLLALSASYLSGVYAVVGQAGAVIVLLVMALSLPYLVALPTAELLWLDRAAREPMAPKGSGGGEK